MKNLYIIISLFLILFNSCNKIAINYEQNAYLDIIPFLIDIDNYYKPAPPPALILKNSSQQKLDIQKNKYDSVLNNYNLLKDTIDKYLFINDTLKPLDIEIIKNNIEKNKDYYSLIQNIKDEKSNEISLKIEGIQGKSNIKLINNDFRTGNSLFDLIGIRNGKLYIGYINLSRIIFNKDYSKGILIYSFICGSKCGESSLVLIEKKNDEWIIKEKIPLTIS